MADNIKKFHEYALQSSLFKGHADWYFCYLKSERIAHILTLLTNTQPEGSVQGLLSRAYKVPESVLYFAAGTVSLSELLAHIFSAISTLRMQGAKGSIEKENVTLLIAEYEAVAERLAIKLQPSPFLTSADLEVPQVQNQATFLGSFALETSKESQGQHKGHKGHKGQAVSYTSHTIQVPSERSVKILAFVKNNKGVSIKQISHAVRGYSEKTIQRELSSLIQQGLVKKAGERRWSVYSGA